VQPSDSSENQSTASTEAEDERNKSHESSKASGPRKLLERVIAVVVTAGVLWFLFGIPAYLLFGILFD
jgi:hypothetical protein